MADLLLHRRKVESVFHLLGEHENGAQQSVAHSSTQTSEQQGLNYLGRLHQLLDILITEELAYFRKLAATVASAATSAGSSQLRKPNPR
jgi:hypothetical protein